EVDLAAALDLDVGIPGQIAIEVALGVGRLDPGDVLLFRDPDARPVELSVGGTGPEDDDFLSFESEERRSAGGDDEQEEDRDDRPAHRWHHASAAALHEREVSCRSRAAPLPIGKTAPRAEARRATMAIRE